MASRNTWILGLLIAVNISSPELRSQTPPPASVFDNSLREQLLKRVEDDQAARKAVLEWMQKQNLNDPEAAKKMVEEPLVKRIAELDQANTKWLKSIIQERGWPGRSMVGDDGAHAAWLLVQHADHDRDFQKLCLKLMKLMAAQGEVSKSDLAYLTDRLRVAENKPQVYGTQFRNENGKMVPVAIEDEAGVDKRRVAVGLPPLAEYRALIERMYNQRPEKK
jgi:hypothetical protein